MTDREKVIEGLEHCRRGPIGCQQGCPYTSDFGCRSQLTADALELLKEQEAVKPIVEQYAFPLTLTSVRFIKKYYCGICKEEITGNNVYCHKCGRKVMWDD